MPIYKDETNNTYYCSFYYQDWQGNKKRKLKRGFKLAREAKQYEKDFLASVAASPDMLFETLAKNYLQDKKARAKATTHATQKHLIERHITPTFAKMPISEITPAHVRQWQNKHLLQYAPTTQKQVCTVLSALFNFAIRFYGLKENPLRQAGSIGTLKADKMQIWTIEQFYSFMSALNSWHVIKYPLDFYIVAYNVLFFSGIRAGELLALTTSDYNPATNEISITKTRTKLGIQAPKSKKSNRLVKLPASVGALLAEHIAKLQEPAPEEPLFPFSHYQLQRVIHKLAAAAGVPDIRVHDLRHSHASMLINSGVQPLAISERLGHENIETTLNIYSHLYKSTSENIAALLDNSIKKVSMKERKP